MQAKHTSTSTYVAYFGKNILISGRRIFYKLSSRQAVDQATLSVAIAGPGFLLLNVKENVRSHSV